mmetsp:Transcript_9919/g.26206  ORF Transcript_9919/g.26206 Transcript_9919/m.26206 type:complete len:201 (+) Transcript_9919:1546-2148(+)
MRRALTSWRNAGNSPAPGAWVWAPAAAGATTPPTFPLAPSALVTGAFATGALAAGALATGALATGALATGAAEPGALGAGALATGVLAGGALAAGDLALPAPFTFSYCARWYAKTALRHSRGRKALGCFASVLGTTPASVFKRVSHSSSDSAHSDDGSVDQTPSSSTNSHAPVAWTLKEHQSLDARPLTPQTSPADCADW